MSNTVRLATRLVGLFAYFVENGATVDAQTVSSSVMPDASPTDNWPNIGDVKEGAAWGKEEQDDGYMKPSSAGGFRKEDRMNAVQDFLTFQTRQMSGLVDRLLFGLSAAISEGSAASPFASSDRYIRGWLMIQGRQVGGNGTGTDDFRMVVWVDLRLAEAPKYENKVLSPTLKATILANALNTINFPAAA